MKCISLWQPWATLIVTGAKKIETRGWFTPYRGPLLIHAAKRKIKKEFMEYAMYKPFAAAFATPVGPALFQELGDLPFGAIVGQVELVQCKRTELLVSESRTPLGGVYEKRLRFPDQLPPELNGSFWTEHDLGNFEPGRYGWVLENPVEFDPVEYKGEQGLFEVWEAIFDE